MPTTLGNPTQPLISLLSLHFSYICICVNKLTVIGSAVNSPPPSQYASTAFFLHFRAYKGHGVGMYRSTHTYAFAISSHIACFPLGGEWGFLPSLKLRKREALRLLSLPRAQHGFYLGPMGLRKGDFLRSEAEWDWRRWGGRGDGMGS